MIVRIKTTFIKDRDRLPTKIQERVDELVAETLPKIQRLSDLPSITDLKGHKGFYRARIGSYRVGLELRSDALVVHRVLHRSVIYRYFP